jgi:hypothetical protein
MEITPGAIRLLAHVLSFGVCIASIGMLLVARGQGLNMRHWRALVLALVGYAVWFFMLALSTRDAEFIRRGEVALLFGLVELLASGAGWVWFVLTARASFCLTHSTHAPYLNREVGR